ncbi:MAG: ABC transporter permease [Dehalococcoidia bacterium]|nr:ABC transporter permease [Dehalococcoidia bacterium]
MNLRDSTVAGLEALWANRLRSSLTMLGMVIGVASVVLLVAVGQGAVSGIEEQIQSLGTNTLFITPGASQQGGGPSGGAGSAQSLTLADSEALGSAALDGVSGVAPTLSTSAQLVGNRSNTRVQVVGTTANYAAVRSLSVASGTFLSGRDVTRGALSVVLGSEVAEEAFPSGNALGSKVRLTFAGEASFPFTVVGVLEQQGGLGGSDNSVYLPVTALQSRVSGLSRNAAGQVFVSQISVLASQEVPESDVKAAVTDFLMRRHRVDTPDFSVLSQDDLLATVRTISTVLTLLLASIAGISLLVGGIGVMNIMLVSVTERTREIGIRLAIGATSADILQQFIAEALFVTLIGGSVGIALGALPALLLNGLPVGGGTLTTSVQGWSIALALLVSGGIGLASGIYPAWRASRLDPIEALRAE